MNIALKHTAIALCLAGLMACTAVEPPNTLATQARESIQQAESVGADESAPLALREANQFLNQAESAINQEEYEEAQKLLEKSIINSELAIARTNSQRSQRAAEQIEQGLDALRRQSSTDSESNTYSIQ